MKQHHYPGQRPKRHPVLGIVILILLLLLGGAALLYHSVVTAPLELDNSQVLAASSPMTPAERFRFDPESQTVQLRLDKADLWNMVLEYAGTDFLEVVNKALSPYSLSVSGCGIHVDESGLRLDAELYYKQIRLPVTVPCDLSIDGRTLAVLPAAVNLGPAALPVEEYLTSAKLEFDLNFPVLSQVTQIGFEKDAILLTGAMDQALRTMVEVDEELYQTAVFCDSIQLASALLLTQESYDALLFCLEQEPGLVEELYRQVFVLAGTEKAESYLNSRSMTERIFPEMDITTLAEEYDVMQAYQKPLFTQLRQFLTNVANDYNDKEFNLSGGEFLKEDQPFQAGQYGDGVYEELFAQLDPDSFFLILVDAGNGYLRNTSSFYHMAQEGLDFTKEVDYNRTYILGCVFRGVGGEPFLLYETEVTSGNTYSRSVSLHPLTQADVDALQVPGRFGVWTDRDE